LFALFCVNECSATSNSKPSKTGGNNSDNGTIEATSQAQTLNPGSQPFSSENKESE
jgi:hypothetical protein